jgi:hypothetical protein
MKLRLLSIAAALLTAFTCSTAYAQVGVYGKFNLVRVPSSSANNFTTSGWFYGPGGGVYFNVVHLGPVSLGGDIRADYLFQSPQRYRDVLFGVRAGAKAPLLPFRPYAQISAGIGGTSVSGVQNSGRAYSNKLQYWIIGGVDHTILPRIDWRIAEIGYGHMTGVSSSPPATGVNLFTLSTGVVVRLP